MAVITAYLLLPDRSISFIPMSHFRHNLSSLICFFPAHREIRRLVQYQ